MIVWLTRLVTSALIALEYTDRLTFYVTPYHSWCWYVIVLSTEVVVSVFFLAVSSMSLTTRKLAAFSLGGLRIQRPPTVKLLEPRSLNRGGSRDSATSNSGPKSDLLFSNLSLTSNNPSSLTNPIFGQPSFPSPVRDIAEEDLMDWTPLQPQETALERVQDREGWMRPQRFFPPEQPTGLEDLFEKARLDVEEHVERQGQQQQTLRENGSDELRELGLFLGAAVAIALVAGIGVYRF